MAITCALGPENIAALAKVIYKKMSTTPEGEVFDVNAYMDYLYEKISEKQGRDVALQYVQQIPFLANRIAAKSEDISIDPNINLRELSKSFRDDATGYQTLETRFSDKLSPSTLSAIATYETETPIVEEVEEEPQAPVDNFADPRLRATTALSGTLEQFMTMDPNEKVEGTIEVVDKSKMRIFNVIDRVRGLTKDLGIGNIVTYDGTEIALRVVKAAEIGREDRTPQTDALIGRMIGLKDRQSDVTPVDELFALVITDRKGKALFFDEQGNISSKAAGGKPVYQMMRDARLVNGRYTVRNIYNTEDQIIAPEDEALNMIKYMGYKSPEEYEADTNKKFADYVKETDDRQQAEFKELYDLKQNAIKKKAPLLNITGASAGVVNSRVRKNFKLNALSNFYPEKLNDIMKSFTVLTTPSLGFRSGATIISLDEQPFQVDRADITKEQAMKIAKALNDPNLSNNRKLKYYSQFYNDLNQNVKSSTDANDTSFVTPVARHRVIRGKKGAPIFIYASYTKEELSRDTSLVNEKKEVILDGSKEAIDKVYEVLIKGKSSARTKERYPAKIDYIDAMFNQNIFYDYQDGKLVESGTYKDFILSLDAEVMINKTNGVPLYNSYLKFAIQDTFSKKVTKAEEETNVDNRSAVRKFKDDLVDVIKNSPEQSVKATIVSSTQTQRDEPIPNSNIVKSITLYTLKVQIEGQEGIHTMYRSTLNPTKEDVIVLTVKDNVSDGLLFKDTIIGRVNGNYAGVLTERDISKGELARPGIPVETITAAQTLDAEELNDIKPQPATVPEGQAALDDQNSINPANTLQPTDSTPVSKAFKRDYSQFDRSGKLNNDVTAKQIADATTWWNNSPLAKFIELEHVANIVNSNVYARFIAAGSSLLAEQNLNGKLGKILINEATKGSMVDTYHEAWHVFSQLFLTREQKAALYDEIRKSAPKFANMSNLDIEEELAEDFRTYAINPKALTSRPVRNSLFRKILNFIRGLFGKTTSIADDIVPNKLATYGVAGELFSNLYLASNNPELLNDYEPLIDNVQFDLLNRGVRQERNTKEDALNERDSNDLVEAIDSVLSETIDNTHDYKKFKGDAFTTSSINILLNPRQKEIAYGFVRDEFVDEIESIKKQLSIKPAVSFNSLTTKKELSDNAAAVIKSTKGDDKYIFLRSQIDDFTNLVLNDKKGTRIKGETYKETIEVIGDFYSHISIMSKDKDNADIIIVDSLEEAQAQFDSYKEGGALSFESITINPTVGTQAIDLDYDQQNLLDRLRILQTAVDNWNSVLKYHREHSSFDLVKQTYKIQENDPEKSETDQKDAVSDVTESESYSKGVGEKSLTELADKEVIYILKSLFARKKVGDNYEYEYGRLGFKKLANFKKVWNGVVRATDGTKDPREMYNRIRAAAVNFPELQQLVDYKIPNPAVEDAKNNTSFDITTSFWNAFSLQRVPYMQLSIFADNNGATTEVTNTSIDVTNTIRKFQGKFAAQTDSPYVSKDRNNNNVLNLERIVKDFSDSSGQLPQDKTFEFLTTIGFKYDDIKAIKDEINTVKKRPYYSIDYLFKVLKDFNNVANKPGQSDEAYEYINAFKRAPLTTLMKGIPAGVVGLEGSTLFLAGSKQSTAINRLITLQNRYGSTGSNFSVLNAAKKRVNEHTSDNSLTVITSAMNSVKNKTELYVQGSVTSYLNPVRNPWTNSLLTMKSLFDATNNRREGRSLVVEMTSGTQVIEKGKSTNESTTTDLDERGKFIQEFHTLLKAGLIEVLRPGSKSSSFAWKIDGGIVNAGIGTKSEDYLYVDFKTFVDAGAEREMIEDIFIPYISSEVQRINIFKTNPEAKNYGGYNKKGRDGKPSGEQFNYFDGILTKDTKAEILSKVNTTDKTLADYISSDSVLGEKIITEVKEYFRKKTVELDKYMQEAKYIDPKLINKFDYPGLSERRKEALLAKTFMYNSWIHNLETSVLFYGDIAQFDHTKQEFHKRTSGLISNGPRFRTDSDAQLFINDIFNNGTTYASTLPGEYNNFRYNGTINTAVIQEIERDSIYIDSIRKGLTKFYETKTLKTAAEIKATVDREVEKYTAKEIKEGDGQGYITIDAYRTLKKLQKKWTDKQEELYQKVINEQEIDATDIVEFFPVYKLQNFGFVEDTVLPVTAMHKFALMPLIPSMIKGSQMESLHKRMLKENIQYLTFESGSKVGGVTSNAKADSVFNADGSFNENATLTKNTINAGFLKEVTTVPSKYKGKVIFSTQLRKLILDGLYEVGDYTMPQYKSLINAYEKTVKFNTDILKAELIEEIGYEPGKGISNPSKFLQIIKDNLRRKDYPEHLLRTLKTNKDGSLKFDLSYSIDAATIESTIMSIVEKKFVKQFVKGEALVQVASSFTQGMWTAPSDSDAKKYMGSNTLPFYDPGVDGNTNAMKVAIALQGDFKNLLNLKHNDGEPIGTRQRLNEMIKNDEWLNKDNNRKSITMTAVRIPVQGINSMEFMEVYEFLDPSAGSIIIVPTEIVAKSGGDFDVDKLTTFMPNINEDGEYVTSDLNEENFFDAYNKTTDPTEKAALMDLQKKAIQNDFIKNIRSILEIPENYANLVRPNDTYILKDVADELEDKVTDIDKYSKVNGEEPNMSIKNGELKKMISPTTTLEPLYNVGKHGANMVGKSVLGIAANENAFNPVFNQAGVILPKKYKATKYEDGREVEDGDAVFDMRLFLPHNEVNGNISLSTINSADGKYRIADIISQGMNGWVDVEKDEWIFYIQGNLELAPTLLYLIQAGVPVDSAAKFVSQPYLREYAKELKLRKSPIGKVIGKDPKEPQYAQYEALMAVLANHMKEYFDANMSKYRPNQKVTYTIKEKDANGYMKPAVKESTVEGLNNLLSSATIELENIDDVSITVGDITKDIYVKPSVKNKDFYNATSFAAENSTKNGQYGIDTLNTLIDKQFMGEKLSADETIASMGMLLHFNEIQKQIKGIGMMKRRGKPDTNLFRNIQEIILRDLDIEALANNSKVDQVSRAKLFDESITSSLGDKSIVIDVISQLLPLRNSSATNDAIKDVLTSSKKRASVILKYGSTSDGNVKFIEDFKNGITNFILQNYLSNFLDKNGSVVDFPTVFNKMPVKLTKNLPTDVVVKDGAVFVNKEKLDYDFKNKMYLNDSTIPGSYGTREGLAPFKLEQDPFPTKESYYRYAVERAYLESQGYKDLELNRLAMINSFNYDAIMKNNEFSYSNAVMDMINAHPNLASTYPILDQISTSTTSGGMNVLTLNDRSVIDGSTKDTYANNIRALANPRIQKVKDPVENARISSLFSLFPLMSVYQHGVGTTNSGFDQVLPQDMIQSTMEKASNLFKLNYWDSRTLDLIKNKLLKDGSKYPNFVATAAEFNAKKVDELPEVLIEDPTEFITPSASVEVGTEVDTRPRYMFNVEPKQKADEKAKIKASIATKYIGFGEGITDSSTAIYAEQAGRFANTGTYGPEDLIFVSVPGRRGNAETAKAQQNKTIREAIQALESGSTIITDNKNYIDNSDYNTGEKRLWDNLNAKGYNYTEKYVQGQRLGFWQKKEFEEVVEPTQDVTNLPGADTTMNIYAGTGENTELSNFAVRNFVYDNISFNSVEQAYQSLKGGKFDKATYDNKAYIPFNRNGVMTVSKFRGPLGTTTDLEQTQLMNKLIKSSFEQNPDALAKLLATGNATLTHTQDKGKWGKEFPRLLMEVRNELRPTQMSIPEIVASGTSKYRGRFSVGSAFMGSTAYVESDVKLRDAINKAIEQTSSKKNKGILRSQISLLGDTILNRNIFLSRDRYTDNSAGNLGVSAAIEFLGIRRTTEGGTITERQAQTMVHELTHMLTLQPFIKEDDGVELTKKETEFLREIRNLYNYIKSLPGSEGKDFYNPMLNEFEFIADAIADEKFREYLNTIEYSEGKSVLSKLIELIKKLLGVKPGTALETVVDQVYSLRADPDFVRYDTLKHLVEEMRLPETESNLKKISQPKAKVEVPITDEFKYFGTMYTIKLDSGLGVDVEGYKGKISAKEKLLAAYNNNPNVDPQNGKPFRVLQTPEEIVEQPKGKFKFADGTIIGVPFELNQEQVKALYTLEDFYNNPEKYDNQVTLSGYAGTGKTTILGIFDKYLGKKSRIAPRYTSPTHRANAVTKMKNPKAKVITLHKLFGLNPMVDLESGDFDLRNTKTESNKKPDISYGDTLIIDESSMITNQLYDLINQNKKDYNLKIIYAGDRGQLGPVQNESNVYSKVFDNTDNQIQLTKVERTGDNPILLNSTRAREGKDFTYVSDEKDGSGVEFFDKENRLNQVIGENLNAMYDSNNMLYFRILTATNTDASNINIKARKVVFGDKADTEPFIKGDVLMGYDNYGDEIINSGDYMISNVSETKVKTITVPIVEYKGGNIIETGRKQFLITGNNIVVKNLLALEDAQDVGLFVAAPGLDQETKLEIGKLLANINSLYRYAVGRERAKLFSMVQGVKDQFALFEDVKDGSRVLMKKTLDYGYAHTIHKSQGGTYNNVLILESGIKPLANFIANKKGIDLSAQAEVERQLKYVAISRASNYAYVYTGSDVTSSTSTDDLQEVIMSPDDPTVATFNFLDPVPEIPTKGSLPMLQSNIDKIFAGEKVISNRTAKINDGIYSLGNTTSVISFRYLGVAKRNGDTVTITNEVTGRVFTKTFDAFSKAEGFKDGKDFIANDRFSANFLNGTQSRFIYEVKPVDATANDVAGTTGRLYPENSPELGEFQEYLAANGGVYPKTFTASNGRTYVMNSDNLYDLVDNQDGIVVGRNINLETGDINEDTGFKEPATASYKKKTISDLEVMKKDFNLEEVLGNKGYDVNELIEQIQSAETMEEVNKIKALINRSIC